MKTFLNRATVSCLAIVAALVFGSMSAEATGAVSPADIEAKPDTITGAEPAKIQLHFVDPKIFQLEQAYHAAYFEVSLMYVDRALFPDLASWENKFDGKIHNQDELTDALNQLVRYLGKNDPDVRLLTT